MTSSASILQKRRELGITTLQNKHVLQQQQSQPKLQSDFNSPNPLKLFRPRTLTLQEKNIVNAVQECRKIYKRTICFVAAGDLTTEGPHHLMEFGFDTCCEINLTEPSVVQKYAPRSSPTDEPKNVVQKYAPQSSPIEPKLAQKYTPRSSPIKEYLSTTPSTSLPLPLTNGNTSRKRVLSERGQEESHYPRINRAIIYSNWEGCNIVNNKRCGIGLYNPMNNCFLNSVLQSIVHIPQIARMIIEGNQENRMCTTYTNTNFKCFHCDLRTHICKAITASTPFRPYWIDQHMRRIFPAHRIGIQEDAHEMLTLLLSALEPSLPKSSHQNGDGVKVDGGIPATPIEQIFGGNLRNEIICNACHHPHTNYERIREFNLGLTRNSNVTLQELIDDFFKPEQLQNFFCIKCQKKQTATRRTHLLSAPTVLIIQLKRFNQFGQKNRTPVKVKPHLFLSNYSYKNENIFYKLQGIIEHIGGGINFGHYICAMRGFDGDFHQFDDSDRKPVHFNTVERMEPYILFFNRMKINQQQQQRHHSIGSCQPSFPKQARMVGLSPYNGGTKIQLNRTFGSFIS